MHHCVPHPFRIAASHGHGTCGNPKARGDHQPEADGVANGNPRSVGCTHPNRDL